MQVVVDNDPLSVVGFQSFGRIAQSEIMALPTVEVRGRRSTGFPRGKMIVMTKRG
jgi:hypothetical protein